MFKCSVAGQVLRLATVNMQELSLHDFSKSGKIAGLVEAARIGGWQITDISDIMLEQKGAVYYVAREELFFVCTPLRWQQDGGKEARNFQQERIQVQVN